MFRSYRKSGLPVVVRHTRIALNSALICPCARSIKDWGGLSILLFSGILQSTAASQELPDAPSAVTGTSFCAAGDSTTSADP
jgi:hypothetical protein